MSLAVTVGGKPAIAGLKIIGLTSLIGGDCFTDSGGNALGLAYNVTTTVSTPQYADLPTASKVISTPIQKIVSETLALEAFVPKTLKIISTANIIFSPYTKKVDICCVGGGGGGGCGCYSSGENSAGSGGGGGYVTNKSDVQVSANTEYTVEIGAGGSGGTGTSKSSGSLYIGTPGYGSSGGKTKFLGAEALGGSRGGYSTAGSSSGGGVGNGNGGNGGPDRYISPTAGTPGSGYIFDDNTLGFAGGGGGGGAGGQKYSMEWWSGAQGGKPNGGAGGSGNANGAPGKNTGGGGGGGYCDGGYTRYGGSGSSGVVYIRI